MGKRILISGLLWFSALMINAQIVRIEPADASGEDEIKVIYDAKQGTGGLVGESKVYMHSGVVTDGPDGTAWTYVVGNWGEDDGLGQMTPVSGQADVWEITLSPSAREYYSVPEGTNMFRLSMVFRNADGSKEGKGSPGSFEGGFVADNQDIYIDLSTGEFITINTPREQDVYYLINGESIQLSATASNPVSSMSVSVDQGSGFNQLASVSSGTQISFDFAPAQSFEGELKFEATIGGEQVEASQPFNVEVIDAIPVAPLPAGIKKGINYHTDDTKVTLVLEAPGKTIAHAVGDFNNWEATDEYIMNKTPDGELFWIELTGLTPGQEYVFQYWVDGVIKIGDPYTDKVADPWNDPFIPATVHDEIPVYGRQNFGVASTFQTAQTPYDWGADEANWQRPDKEDLIVYELLIRDFIGTHDYKGMIDTLGYLKTLGVNAIELMPIMEFEGNESWGYNPMYFFAVDKYYGKKNDLKDFIKACHEQGFAVILDMVMNHAFGLNAMVHLYREDYGDYGSAPTEDNPWFNTEATHPFNVGFDFNHESPYTQDLLDSVNRYWIEEYHFDGYRFDLSKGFTQTRNTDVGRWSAYDQSRVDLLERMANKIWSYDSEAYVILEHFADGSEENALTGMGMLSWRNLVYNYYLPLGGHANQTDFNAARASTHVSYMESHDEQRQIWEVQNSSDWSGRITGNYNTQATIVALDRLKQNAAFIYLLPGPKMLWQFGELGYDIDINENGRTGNKPLPWGAEGLGYYDDEERYKVYQAFSAIINLRTQNSEAFRNGVFTTDLSSETRRIKMESDDFDMVVVGNFGMESASYNGQFTQTGTWYDYITGDELSVNDTNLEIELLPGEFRIYTSVRKSDGFGDIVNVYNGLVTSIGDELPGFKYYPNPTTGMISFEGELPQQPQMVNIYNASGQLVQTVEEPKRKLEPIDLSAADNGLYIIRILTGDRAYAIKILKQ